MTPVDEEKTRAGGMPSAAATAPVTASTDIWPCAPVKALALPEFTTIAAPASEGTLALSFAWQSRMQAARVEERVKAPATDVPAARRTSITSLRLA